TAGFDDCQVATLVTDRVVPSEREATALNCDVWPMRGDEPVTVIAVIETDGVGSGVGAAGDWDPLPPPHAGTINASPVNSAVHPVSEFGTKRGEPVILSSRSLTDKLPEIRS